MTKEHIELTETLIDYVVHRHLFRNKGLEPEVLISELNETINDIFIIDFSVALMDGKVIIQSKDSDLIKVERNIK